MNILKTEPAMIIAVIIAATNVAVLYGLITADAAPLWIALAESVVVLVGGYVVRQSVYSRDTVERTRPPMGRSR